MLIRSDRRYDLDVAVPYVWDAMASPADFTGWWPWLGAFDGRRLAPGERWNCVVQPPLPYRVGFLLTIGEVIEEEVVTATVSGDIRGKARIDLVPREEGGSIVRLRAELSPSNAALQVVARIARPVVTFGHDWVLDTGFRQFRSHLDRTGPAGASCS